MKNFTFVTLIALLVISFNSFAHEGGHGVATKIVNISQQQAIEIATKKVSEKIESNDLDSSWSSVDSKTAVLERTNGRQSWKVTLKQLSSTSTEVLNVYLTKSGVFISISK